MELQVSHHRALTVDDDEIHLSGRQSWTGVPWICLAVGVVGLSIAWYLGRQHPQKFYFSYLTSFMFWLSIALGGLFFTIVQFAAKAGWSVVVRRLAENAMLPLWFLGVLFVPIYLGMHDLFHWTHADAVAADPILQGKAPYLNTSFFLARAVLYFVVWIGIGVYFYRNSVRQDQSGDEALTRRLQTASGPAILLFALTITFAAFDWIMSLDPHWFSTIFGVYYFAGSVVAIFAFLALVSLVLQKTGALKRVITVEHYHDLGKLLFAFTVFWSYIAFSQFMLYWYANVPEETLWYAERAHGSWRSLSIVLGVGHFALPFFYLMTRLTKRRTGTLMFATLWLLVMHYLDLYWLIMPQNHSLHGVELGPLDLATFAGIGGLYLAYFTGLLRRYALIPRRDPRLVESLTFENF
jgi:hypothetical protein